MLAIIWAGVVRVSGRCGDQPWSQPVVTVFRGNQRLLASAKLWKSYTQPSPVCGSSYYNQHIKADHKIGQLLFFLKPKIEKIIIGYRRDSDRLPLPWSLLYWRLSSVVSSPHLPDHLVTLTTDYLVFCDNNRPLVPGITDVPQVATRTDLLSMNCEAHVTSGGTQRKSFFVQNVF